MLFLQGLSGNTINTHSVNNHQHPLSFKKGEIFFGKVTKILNHPFAIIQVNGREVTAQLNTALELNKNYWFQVMETGNVVVKIIHPKAHENLEAMILKHLGLTWSSELNTLLKHFQMNQLPLSKEWIMEGSKWLKESDPSNIGVQVISEMVRKGLPISKDIYRSLYEQHLNRPMSELFKQVYEALITSKQTPISKQLEQTFQQFLFSNYDKIQMIRNELLQQLLHPNTKDGEGEIMFQMLKKLGLSPTIASKEQLIMEMVQKWTGRTISEGSFLTFEQAKSLLNESIPLQTSAKTVNQMEQLNLFTESKWPGNIGERFMPSFSVKEQAILQQIFGSKTPHIVQWSNAIEIKDFFQFLMKEIGFQYEFDKFAKNRHDDYPTLKELLIQTIKHDPSSPLAKAAEQLLFRITGQQMAIDPSNPIVQAQFQIPVAMFHEPINITIRWNGKKDDHQKLDPNFCRILLFFHLEKLGEIAIDLNIQNRMISMKIYNNYPRLENAIGPFIPLLKEQLKKFDYHLSSVQTKPYQDYEEQPPFGPSSPHFLSSSTVDVKI